MTDDELMNLAREAMKQAWAPYSGFHVGAALLAEDGRTFTGCNVENASYGLTICAERTTVVKAVSEGARAFTKLALVCDGDHPVPPCGACLQVLREFSKDLPMILFDLHGREIRTDLAALLPGAFDATDLNESGCGGTA